MNLISQVLELLQLDRHELVLASRGIDGVFPVVELLPKLTQSGKACTRGEKGFAQVALPFGNQAATRRQKLMVQSEKLLELLFRQSADKGPQRFLGDHGLVIAGPQCFLLALASDAFQNIAVRAGKRRLNAKLRSSCG